jgi:RNA polymerase sigma-70 factor (ECF subfamily)
MFGNVSSISAAPLSPVQDRASTTETHAGARAEGQPFSEFYDEHLDFVFRNVRHFLVGMDSQVEDVVQEVFVIVARRRAEFDGRSPRSWLYSILRRVAANHRRAVRHRKKQRDSVDVDEIEAKDSGPHRKAENAEAARLFLSMLGEIDDDKREVFVLMEIEQMTAPQIAELLGLNVTTVHARLRDARRELATIAQRLRGERKGGMP